MKKSLMILGLWCLVGLATAADGPFREDVPKRYTVKPGDTLWGISGMFLRDPWLWPEVWQANPQIENPHLIYPGDVISLVYVDGEPRLTLEREGHTDVPRDGRTVKLKPEVRVTQHETAIDAIPLEAVNTFLARTRVVAPGVLEAAPYVLAGQEKRLMAGVGDDFYARGSLEDDVSFYGIFRKGDPYIDPDSEEVLGIKAEDIGSAQLKKQNDGISTFQATRSVKEIRVGDRLLPHEERRLDPTFFPAAPDSDISGELIGVEGGVTQVGTLDVVALNRGEREGLAIGDVLAIHKAGEQIRDRVSGERIQLPSERAGVLMVFRTFQKMSFGLVLNAEQPLAVGDEVQSP